MVPLGLLRLVSARLMCRPQAAVVLLGALLLGPLLRVFQQQAPIQDGSWDLGPAWIQLLALGGATGGIWALSGTTVARRQAAESEKWAQNPWVVALAVAVPTLLAAASLAGSGAPVPGALLVAAPLKLGALAALGLRWSGGRTSFALVLLWVAVWILPQGMGSPFPALLGLPLEPNLAVQGLACAGLLFLGRSTPSLT